jgi:hypothetical protein
MGSVQAVMAPPADSLAVSDIMMADEMEDFVGHSASDGPEANENLGSSADQEIQFDRLRSAAAPLLASLQYGSLSLPIKRKRL